MERGALGELAHAVLRDELGATSVGRLCPRCGSSEHGRPYVVGSDAHVSISYATDLVAVAWSDGPVGIDVEADLPTRDGIDLLEWTRVEAAFKAGGEPHLEDLPLPRGYVGSVAGEGVSWRLAGPAAPAAPAR